MACFIEFSHQTTSTWQWHVGQPWIFSDANLQENFRVELLNSVEFVQLDGHELEYMERLTKRWIVFPKGRVVKLNQFLSQVLVEIVTHWFVSKQHATKTEVQIILESQAQIKTIEICKQLYEIDRPDTDKQKDQFVAEFRATVDLLRGQLAPHCLDSMIED